MDYKIATKIIGYLDLITTASCLIVPIFGFIFRRPFIMTLDPSVALFIPPALYFIGIMYWADTELILSTKKEQDPESSIKLINPWVYISYFTLCFRILWFFHSDESFLVLILIFIRVFQINCVIKYRHQLKRQQTIRSGDNIIIRGSMRTEEVVSNCPNNSAGTIITPIPLRLIPDINENGSGRLAMSISMQDLPSYESAVFTSIKFYSPPPSYDSLYNKKDTKVTAV